MTESQWGRIIQRKINVCLSLHNHGETLVRKNPESTEEKTYVGKFFQITGVYRVMRLCQVMPEGQIENIDR